MEYVELRISIKDELQELLIAEMFDMDFEGFEQLDDILIASIPSNRFDDSKREEIEQKLMRFGGGSSILKEEVIAQKNWNEEWERSIQPQTIGQFYVHPTWSTFEGDLGDKIELMIDPKMAFGTGYHATTRIMLEWLPDVVEKRDTVLDAGTGTGILAIAALKLGAESAFGFDVDEWSKTNAEENILLNKVEDFEVKLGSTEVIPKKKTYDVILANINRNALIELLPDLILHLNEDGKILLSGLLEEDEPAILKQPAIESLTHKETRQLKEWIGVLFEA